MLLPDAATCVVVGDVTGHDVGAAPLMGELRNMLRALAFDRWDAGRCVPPGRVVSRLDRALTMLEDPPPRPWCSAASSTARTDTPSTGPTPGIRPRCSSPRPAPPAVGARPARDLRWASIRPSPASTTHTPEEAAALAGAPPDALCDGLIARGRQVFDDDVALPALRVPGGPAP
ncbi:SpoIIE family protein phosphatase [Streptomyces collinus]|uniref:SpoIIE family protein phosphatase n=1 Tax=Streptomyces collinus TaxID=42684 RepID=UPI0036BE5C32